MRIWSLHPKYLDSKGLVALWRETLLAQNVLAGNTKGYKSHPQLLRFKNTAEPMQYIGTYLMYVYEEAASRGYNFNAEKIREINKDLSPIEVTTGQLEFEFEHLKAKLIKRDPKKYELIKDIIMPEPCELFKPVAGDVEEWERV